MPNTNTHTTHRVLTAHLYDYNENLRTFILMSTNTVSTKVVKFFPHIHCVTINNQAKVVYSLNKYVKTQQLADKWTAASWLFFFPSTSLMVWTMFGTSVISLVRATDDILLSPVFHTPTMLDNLLCLSGLFSGYLLTTQWTCLWYWYAYGIACHV